MNTTNLFFIILIGLSFSSCKSDDDMGNQTIDLSQFDDYNLTFAVRLIPSQANEAYEFETVLITTDENNKRIEVSQTYSGISMSDSSEFITDTKAVKGYKQVGMLIKDLSNNLDRAFVKLERINDNNIAFDTDETLFSTVTFLYSFETETLNVF